MMLIGWTLACLALLVFVFLVTAASLWAGVGRDTPRTLPALDPNRIAQHLADAVRCRTISHQDAEDFDPCPFQELRESLETGFPTVHAELERETVAEHSLLYTWPGSNPKLRPILLMGHLDVVPVEEDTEDDWTHPPFDGVIEDGFVWGRGTLDMKSAVVAILEAVERLLNEGFQPKRTVFLAFGHDEETMGMRGASEIVRLLESRNVRLEWVLDEGGAIVEDMPLGGVKNPVALVGHGEKGYLTLELSVESEGGHAAVPPRQTSVGRMARALTRLERRPFPAKLRQPVTGLLIELSQVMPKIQRLIMANLWLFRPVVARMMTRNPATASLVRTTTAITVVRAGGKENVLAQSAKALVNFRILPGETTESVIQRVCRIIADSHVQVRRIGASWDPTPTTPLESTAYKALGDVIRQTYPGVVVVPNLVNGATDARHYAPLTRYVFRFTPLVLTPDDLGRIHGTDERISVESVARCVAFFRRLIQETTA